MQGRMILKQDDKPNSMQKQPPSGVTILRHAREQKNKKKQSISRCSCRDMNPRPKKTNRIALNSTLTFGDYQGSRPTNNKSLPTQSFILQHKKSSYSPNKKKTPDFVLSFSNNLHDLCQEFQGFIIRFRVIILPWITVTRCLTRSVCDGHSLAYLSDKRYINTGGNISR